MNVNCAFSIKSIVLDPDISSLEKFFYKYVECKNDKRLLAHRRGAAQCEYNSKILQKHLMHLVPVGVFMTNIVCLYV